MVNLNTSIENNHFSKEKLLAIYNQSYKPYLKALSYSLLDKQIIIYTHAPVDLAIISLLAFQLKVHYCDDSAEALAISIDEINNAFKRHVMQDKVSSLYDQEDIYYLNSRKRKSKSAIALLTWNRDHHSLQFKQQLKNGDLIYFIHGHDSEESTASNVFTLDNQLGKSEESAGLYTVYLI